MVLMDQEALNVMAVNTPHRHIDASPTQLTEKAENSDDNDPQQQRHEVMDVEPHTFDMVEIEKNQKKKKTLVHGALHLISISTIT